MADLKDAYLNDNNYNSPTYTTEWYNISSYQNITYTVFCSQNCNILIEYSTDNNFSVILTETGSVVANTSTTLYSQVKARYIRFKVSAIASNPAHLIVQILYS